jgi:hypothetical protein
MIFYYIVFAFFVFVLFFRVARLLSSALLCVIDDVASC